MKYAREVIEAKGSVIEIVNFEPEVRKNENGLIQIFPLSFLSTFQDFQYPIRWSQGFIVARGKVFSVIYPEEIESQGRVEGIQSDEGRVIEIKCWLEIAFPLMGTTDGFPSSHGDLKQEAERSWKDTFWKEEIGGGVLNFYCDQEKGTIRLSIEISGFSGEFGREKDRARTVEIVCSLFPEAKEVKEEK